MSAIKKIERGGSDMSGTRVLLSGFVAACALLTGVASGHAADTYKVGEAVALSGYLATVDRAWKDAVVLAANELNKTGGVLGHKVDVNFEDNRSEPIDTVTIVKKLLSADHVNILINGCSSAGNAAAAPLAERAGVPMLLCSILPPKEENHKWAFSLLPPPAYEVEPRLAYLQKDTQIRKIGILYDPSPYAGLQKKIAEAKAGQFGLQVVGAEQFQQNDADMTAYINKLVAQGAGAILKMGVGPSTLTIAKGIKQLGLKIPLLASTEDVAVFKGVAQVLGPQFFFVAGLSQVYEALPEGATSTKAVGAFVKAWRAKFGERDTLWAARGWDAVHVMALALKKANATDGAKVRDAIEQIGTYEGAAGEYAFTAKAHYGITKNPFLLAQIIDGKVRLVK
jgi:branched-chain amino acid transport system substrate-binding protein